MKNKIAHAKTIKEAIDNFQTFLDVDLYTKFRPEQKIQGEKWYRQDWFKNEKEFREYLDDHFNILRKEINKVRKKK